MRMRRKKHLKERMELCSDIIITDMKALDGDIKAIFNDNKPLRMEIGCGKGGFILETAKRHPEVNFLAVEKNSNVLILAAEKIKNANLANVKFLRGDANLLRDIETESKCDVINLRPMNSI